MPVLLNCECGRQLRVPDELVGRRIKCPACGTPQTVEAAAPAKASADPARRPTLKTPPPDDVPEPASSGIRFSCDGCGRQIKARAEYAGRATKCPGCGTSLRVPVSASPSRTTSPSRRFEETEGRIRSEPPRRPARPAREVPAVEEVEEVEELEAADESEEDDRPARRPKRRKGKGKAKGGSSRRVWPWVAGAVGLLLLLVGGGIGGYLLYQRARGSDALATYIPADATAFSTMRVADLSKSDSVKGFLRQVAPNALRGPNGDILANLEKEAGLKLADFEQVSFVISDPNNQDIWWIIATTVNPYDRDRLLTNGGEKVEEATYQNKKYYYTTKNNRMALLFHDKRSFVMGPEPALKRCLDLAARKDVSGPLADAIKEARGSKDHVFVAFAPPRAEMQKARDNAKTPFFDGTPYLPLLELRSGVVTINVPGGALDLTVRLSYPDAAKAQAAKDAAVKGIAYVNESALPMLKVMIPGNADPKFGQSLDNVEATLKALAPQQSGDTVTLQIKLQISDLENLIPRPAMAQPGMPGGVQPGNPPGGFQPGNQPRRPQPGGQPPGGMRPPRRPRGPQG